MLVQFGDFSQQSTTLSIVLQDCCIPLHPKGSSQSRHGVHGIAAVDVPPLPCGSSADFAGSSPLLLCLARSLEGHGTWSEPDLSPSPTSTAELAFPVQGGATEGNPGADIRDPGLSSQGVPRSSSKREVIPPACSVTATTKVFVADLTFPQPDLLRPRAFQVCQLRPFLRVGGSFSARVPKSSAEVHRGFSDHILEDEVDGQEEEQG